MMIQMISHWYRQLFKGLKGTKEEKSNEKAVTFHKDDSKIDNLKDKIDRLQDHNKRLQNQIHCSRSRECEFQKILTNYDNLLGRMVSEKKGLVQENVNIKKQLDSYESAFNDLVQKYDRAKFIILVLQDNDKMLRQGLEELNKRQCHNQRKMRPKHDQEGRTR